MHALSPKEGGVMLLDDFRQGGGGIKNQIFKDHPKYIVPNGEIMYGH